MRKQFERPSRKCLWSSIQTRTKTILTRLKLNSKRLQKRMKYFPTPKRERPMICMERMVWNKNNKDKTLNIKEVTGNSFILTLKTSSKEEEVEDSTSEDSVNKVIINSSKRSKMGKSSFLKVMLSSLTLTQWASFTEEIKYGLFSSLRQMMKGQRRYEMNTKLWVKSSME